MLVKGLRSLLRKSVIRLRRLGVKWLRPIGLLSVSIRWSHAGRLGLLTSTCWCQGGGIDVGGGIYALIVAHG